MQITGEHTFSAPPEEVLDFMLDPEVLKACLPGCERLEEVGPDEYEATMTIGIAMIKGKYDGKVKISDKDEPHSYKMAVEGKGPQGQVSGVGTIELTPDNGGTLVHYSGDATVRGVLARVGARVMQPAAKMITGQFFERMEKQAAKTA
jgi:carbon monoxide dehydrogenase subunit G